MDLEFERELRESLYIHRPLPLHRERGLEAAFPRKPVTARRAISGMPKAGGTAAFEEHPEFLRMSAPPNPGRAHPAPERVRCQPGRGSRPRPLLPGGGHGF